MQRERLTLERIKRFSCPDGKRQDFLWDSEMPRLAVRATAPGAKAFIFETKLNRQTIRLTIGDVRAWTLDDARAEARRLRKNPLAKNPEIWEALRKAPPRGWQFFENRQGQYIEHQDGYTGRHHFNTICGEERKKIRG